jgi:MYXO-CTERM domain-containing protein
MTRILGALAVLCLVTTSALAERPRAVYVPMPVTDPNPTVSSNVIFLNNCQPSGCVVRNVGGVDDSTHDYSSIGQGTVQPFMYDATTWNDVVGCVKNVFAPFNVQIVATRPSSGSYLEILVAGVPQNIGQGSGVGGIAPFRCQSYQANALVFDFANVWQGSVEEICATAAQEIAHTWSLDHSTDASDPMTYYSFQGIKQFDNKTQQCGSDCINGQSPLGQACSGSPAQQHPCYCTGSETQNSYAEILALFGPGTETPPTVAIVNPHDGDNVQPGFPVGATATSPYGAVPKAELRVDGTLVTTLTSQPFAFNAPSSLAPGNHTVEVTAYDVHGVTGKQQISVYIGAPCKKPADCPESTQTCVGGRCVAGPGVQGGLGMACTMNTQCASGQCATDGTNMYCVVPCMTGQCPTGFGCELTSGNMGVCWPGVSDGGGGGGGGGCSTDGGGKPLLFVLTSLAGLLVVRRKRDSIA